jgi:3-phenylpropionate/trans-cinnamate dioxygenase ferredoxin reductase component
MKEYKYLIVGGGMTAAAAVKGIREIDEHGSLALFSMETVPPYDRPPLSKGLWKDKKVESIWRDIDDHSVDVYLNHSIVKLKPGENLVQDQDGQQFKYEKCLLATGGTPRQLPFGAGHILYYRTFSDYEELRQKVEQGGKFAVIGGGFIGSEIAAAICMHDQPVSMIFPDSGMGGNRFPDDLSLFLNRIYRQKGVKVLDGVRLEGLAVKADGMKVLQLDDGTELEADHIVAGIGIKPNISLAESAGLEVEDGILVDENLRTSSQDIYAAGDVAAFRASGLGGRLRVEHEDNANVMGRIAGHNLAGQNEPYDYLPMFYSDLFEYGYEAVGMLNNNLTTYANWQDQFNKGVIFYLDAGRVKGVLLWNVWDKVDGAREIIKSEESHTESELKKISQSWLGL